MPSGLRRGALILFAAVFAAMAVLYHPAAGWNVNTRLNLVFAVVDQHTLAIDDYHDTPPHDTGDKAVFGGRFYSDKIFGVSALAAPFYWIARTVAGGSLSHAAGHWIMKTGAVALPGALSAVLFWLLLARLGAPPRRAMALAAMSLFGTMWYGYGTVFYPYIPGIAAGLSALYLVFFPFANRVTKANAMGIGALLGFMLLCDLIFGILAAGIGFVFLLRLLDQAGFWGQRAFAQMSGDRSTGKQIAGLALLFAAGAALPLVPFAAYCKAIFGSFTIPYAYEFDPEFREGMSRGVMGVTAPKLHALWFLTLHPFRGLFFWSPVLAAGLAGCVLATRQFGKRRIVGWLGLFSFAGHLLFNAGYYMWWGGWAMGPRLMLPMVPFVLLGLGELARSGKLSAFEYAPAWAPRAWWGAVGAGALSVALTLPLSLADPQLPQGNPAQALSSAGLGTDLAVPQFAAHAAFWSGRISIAPNVRWSGANSTDSPAANLLGILFFAGAIGGLLVLAARAAPEKIDGIHRNDYPFHTVDGTAAPAPVPMRATG